MIINGIAKVVSLQQNSEAWMRWREAGLGASDVPTIMGESPYKTARQLWEERVGLREREASNPMMAYGHRFEERARQLYNDAYAESMVPYCIESIERPHFRASLDGLNMDHDLSLEVKNHVSIKDHLTAREGQVPAHYYGQVQFHIAVAGVKTEHFWSCFNLHDPDPTKWSTALVEVEADLAYIVKMVAEVEKFWAAVQSRKWDDGTVAPVEVLDLSRDVVWCSLAAQYRSVYSEWVAIEERKANLEIAIKRKALGTSLTVGSGIQVKKTPRHGQIEYAAIPAIRSMGADEVESYRKKGTTAVSVEVKE
jgi:putative phage-type endonuclease